ncbi:MAG: ral nucleoside transport system ATP-binding protein [Thermomicrobiales bacterium]|nr:ral nucleoside transport system ATP-binding protein [Thermomicrobiales bacterium]
MPNTTSSLAIEMRGITKRFAGVVANDDVDFEACFGEVHALIGENGAGKSTLMSILAGLYRPDAGTVAISGQTVQFRSPRDAIAHGIGMVYQHFMLVETFTVAENMLLGREGQGTRLETSAVEQEVMALGKRFELEIDPQARIWQLSVGEQQRVEILRALFRGAKILVLDEPTAVLTPQEAEGLIRTLRGMAAQGFCVVFISHKLDEVLAVADRITVLRRGKTVTTVEARETDRHTLARLMVGRELAPLVEHPAEEADDEGREEGRVETVASSALELRGIGALGDKGLPSLIDVDLDVREGEVLGIAGVAGNGQRELAEVITGLRRATSGTVRVDDRDLTNGSPAAIAAAGVAHVPEDRLADGLIPDMDIAGNAILRGYDRPPLARSVFLVPRAIEAFADRLIHDYDVKTPSRRTRLRLLSGGNQQKLLLARELSGEPRVIVAVHPTRGVDVGATETIHRLLREQRRRGAAILLISEDLDELLALSDRIAVIYGGRIMGTVPAAGADPEHLGLLMAGIRPNAALAHG